MQLLSEPSNITLERENLTKTLDVLSKAKKAISKDPELSSAAGLEEEKK